MKSGRNSETQKGFQLEAFLTARKGMDSNAPCWSQLFNDLYIFAETPIQSALYASRLNFNECNGFLSDVIQTVAKKAVIAKHEKNHIPNFIHLVIFFW